jgi:hypothetical protein
MKVLVVPPRSRFRPVRCRSRPGSSRGRTRRSWRRCRRRAWRWQTRDSGTGSGPVAASTGALSVSNAALAAMTWAAVTAMWASSSLMVPPGPRRAVWARTPIAPAGALKDPRHVLGEPMHTGGPAHKPDDAHRGRGPHSSHLFDNGSQGAKVQYREELVPRNMGWMRSPRCRTVWRAGQTPTKEPCRDCLQLQNLVRTLNLAGTGPLPALLRRALSSAAELRRVDGRPARGSPRQSHSRTALPGSPGGRRDYPDSSTAEVKDGCPISTCFRHREEFLYDWLA